MYKRQLLVSAVDSDLNNDNLVDRLALFGSRAITAVGPSGGFEWSSGPELLEWARALRPGRIDAAAEEQGMEPAALATAALGDRPRLVSALKGAGLLAVHDLDVARTPRLVALVPTLDEPCAVAASQVGSTALVAVVDSVLGRVVLHQLSQ